VDAAGGSHHRLIYRSATLFFFFTLVTGPRRSLSLKLCDTRVYEPYIRAYRSATPRCRANLETIRQSRPYSGLGVSHCRYVECRVLSIRYWVVLFISISLVSMKMCTDAASGRVGAGHLLSLSIQHLQFPDSQEKTDAVFRQGRRRCVLTWCGAGSLQGYLAHKKHPPPRTLQ